MVKNVVPVMAKGGRIINVSSIVSKTGMGAMPIYSSSKAALDSLSYCWAQEVSEFTGPAVLMSSSSNARR
jgi:NAD(P)-dependent dehydrogenase (short-subunit alcohol dehydrogenase family)